MSLLETVLTCVLLAGSAYAVAVWAFKKDTKIENRRRGAAKLASVLSNLGLKRTPEFLIDYSVGDYSGMAERITELAKLFLSGEAAVIEEFAQVFDSVLAAKLRTDSGRALIAAKLSDSVKSSDPSVVKDAPVPAAL